MSIINRLTIILTILFTLSNISDSTAMFMDLEDEQITEAINLGIEKADQDDFEFLSHWIVTMKENKGQALLNTEFISLAYESKKASKGGYQMNENDINDTLARTRGRLVFSATLNGRGRNFAKDNEAVLLVDRNGKEEEVISTFWENGDAKRVSGKVYESECSYWFPAKDINPDDTVTLLVTSTLGDEWEFTFKLSNIQ